MSLLMQALRKAERARTQNGHDAELGHGREQQPFGADAVPSPPPIEGGPAFAVMPDAWRLEPLDAEPPVMAAQEAVHDPVPPQARHEPMRPAAESRLPPAASTGDSLRASASPGYGAGNGARAAGPGAGPGGDPAARPGPARRPGLSRAAASPQRRLALLAGTLAALLAVFAFIYWRAVSAPGPGARLPMVPMPAPGSAPVAQAGSQQGAPIPVTPYVTPPGADPALPATAPASVAGAAEGGSTAAASGAGGAAANGTASLAGTSTPDSSAAATGTATAPGAKAPATRPAADVTIPTPEQLAAITDPAIRAEAMRDAAERAARQVRAEGTPAPAHESAATRAHAEETFKVRRSAPAARPQGEAGAGSERAATVQTAVGEQGKVQFVRGTGSVQVVPAVQNGYAALQSGDLATARQQYDLALLQDPNNRDALLGSAAVALREHDGRQASGNYLRLLELDPNDPEALAGLTELRPGDLQADETRLRGLARQHPDSGPVQFALGNLFARQGRWPEAQQSYFRAFSTMPENADYAFNLGVGLDRMNQPRLAQTYYRRALELAQASPPGFNVETVRKRLQALETPPQ
ncbi:hypothetical protein ACN9MU_15845 [Pseudoduganella sp. R-32]|uniref:tetratricopeptide repeat protein n=1 Tax=Pseudoduganella sp. R-32 TaxID=3404061 RepID=UPI003CF19159